MSINTQRWRLLDLKTKQNKTKQVSKRIRRVYGCVNYNVYI